jgi:hypothetical protein
MTNNSILINNSRVFMPYLLWSLRIFKIPWGDYSVPTLKIKPWGGAWEEGHDIGLF